MMKTLIPRTAHPRIKLAFTSVLLSQGEQLILYRLQKSDRNLHPIQVYYEDYDVRVKD